jgi:cullin 1
VKATVLTPNTSSVSSSELLAAYCDLILKNTAEKMTDDDLDETLSRVVNLFGYITDKDLFSEFYRKHLSRRLLLCATRDETERALISKLKLKCGAPYTSKLEGMINDRNVSEETQNDFKIYLQSKRINPGFEFSAQVLTTGFWPAFRVDSLVCPESIKGMLSTFRSFYDSRTQSRVLRWVHSLGTVTLRALFPKGEKELATSAYQACVLLLFNQPSPCTLSGSDIIDRTQLPWEEVKRCLQSLAVGRYRILLRETMGREVKESDTFAVNDDFTERQRKLKIPSVISKINVKNTAVVVQQVEEDRRHAIEACIVRVMKSRKTMEHTQLVSEAIVQLSQHFKPDPKMIKKRIDDLITREYLERDSERPSLYIYMA